jgi:hypothetical protein
MSIGSPSHRQRGHQGRRGAAFAFADCLKVAAPIVIAKSIGQRQWGAATLGLAVWGTFTVCSAVSAIGFASANRTFAVDTRTVQSALNQSRLRSLEADQSELRRLRDRLALPELGRTERLQLTAASQRLETTIGLTRGKLEDAAPVVSVSNPQAHTLATLTGAGLDKVEVALTLLVALLVEMGGFGPFITMSLAKKLRETNVPTAPPAPEPNPQRKATGPRTTPQLKRTAKALFRTPGPPRLFCSSVLRENLLSDLGRFLSLHARCDEASTLGSTDLLTRYNGLRRTQGLPPLSQRRFGDTMSALGHRKKQRLSSGLVHYQGLAWVESGPMRVAA